MVKQEKIEQEMNGNCNKLLTSVSLLNWMLTFIIRFNQYQKRKASLSS